MSNVNHTGSDVGDNAVQDKNPVEQINHQTQEETSDKSPSTTSEKVSESVLDTKCGWFGFTPGFLQTFHTSRWLLGFMCLMLMVQGSVIVGMVSSSLSMIEKRFGLSSSQTGLISAFYDIGVVLVLVLVTYKGGQGHKGRWIAAGSVIMGLGSLCFSLPHFTSGIYEYDPVFDPTCVQGRNSSSHCLTQPSLSNYFWLFLFAQILHGFGASPMFTLTFVYIDENVLQKNSAMYTSLLYVASIIGPGIGYLSSGPFLNIYGELGAVSTSTIDITPEDPRWYGAWWLGFVICSVLAFIIAAPLSGYAKQLPKAETFQKLRSKEAQSGTSGTVSHHNFGKTAKDFPIALNNLLTNKPYMFCVLSDSMEGFVMGAYATFLPKLLENVFSVSASTASVLVGGIVITAAVAGSLLSGVLMFKLNMSCKTMLKYCLICIGISLAACSSLFLVMACDSVPYAGVTVQYGTHGTREGMAVLTAECNTKCQCSGEIYLPVCGADNVMYFSPCHASCETQMNSTTYSQCACVGNTSDAVTRKGKCPPSCDLMPAFLASTFILTFLMFMVATPQIQVILRCVAYSQRALATGCGWVSARLLGTIPGPIIIGQLFDSTCVAWGTKCDERTSCLFYDNKDLAWKMVLVTLAIKVLSLLFAFLAWFSYKPEDASDKDLTDVNKGLEDLVVNGDNLAYETTL